MDIRQDILDNRKTFLFYFDWDKYVQKMDDAQAGRLLKAILALAMREEHIDLSDDLALEISFIGIGDTIVRDTEKYVDKCRKNRENGANGGRPKKEPTDNPQKPNGYFGFSEKTEQNPEKPDIDIDIDSDRKTDIDIDRYIDIDNGQEDYVFHDGTCRKYGYEMFIDKWNSICTHGISKIKNLSQHQKDGIDAIIKAYDFNTLLYVVDKITESDYLMGKKNNSGIQLDFFLKMESFQKIMNDFYRNKN